MDWNAIQRSVTHNRRRSITITALLCGCLLVVGGAVEPPKIGMDDREIELKKLEGTWEHLWSKFQDREISDMPKIHLEIKGGKFTYKTPDNSSTNRITHLDPKSDPKCIDLTSKPPYPVLRAIYKLEGETLTVCTTPCGERPTDFRTERGFGNIVTLYRRVKAGRP
jgi:uncharacterized protein (TIGR03067 family)